MNAKLLQWGICLCGFSFSTLCAQSYSSRASTNGINPSIEQTLQQLKNKLSDCKYQINNQETEIQTLKEKFQTQDLSFEQIQEQLSASLDNQKTQLQQLTYSSEQKLEILHQSQKSSETLLRGIVSDMQQIRTQVNESIGVFNQHNQKINELEKTISLQEQHIQNLESALRSIVEALQMKNPLKTTSLKEEESKIYKVQPGDSLEKIARRYNTSVQALRELNQLTNDRIVVDQFLKIP